MTPAEIIESLNEETDGEAILYPNYEAALIGICRRFGQPPVALYDAKKCLEILIREASESPSTPAYEQAMEWFEFNTLGNWAGEHTPAFAFLEEF